MPARRVPTVIKKAKGTLRKCRESKNEPKYVLIKEIPDPPEYFDSVGRDIYYSTASELLKLGVLTAISLPIFVMYCYEVSIYYKSLKELSKSPIIIKGAVGDPKPNPWLKISNIALVNATKLAGEFGITPATSGKVTATGIREIDPKAEKLRKMSGL